jgi:hypothetical protein
MKRVTTLQFLLLSMIVSLTITPSTSAQTRVKPGMNLFSLRDDVAIGRRGASEIEDCEARRRPMRSTRGSCRVRYRRSISLAPLRLCDQWVDKFRAQRRRAGRRHGSRDYACHLASWHQPGVKSRPRPDAATAVWRLTGPRRRFDAHATRHRPGVEFGTDEIQSRCRNPIGCRRRSIDAQGRVRPARHGEISRPAQRRRRRVFFLASEPLEPRRADRARNQHVLQTVKQLHEQGEQRPDPAPPGPSFAIVNSPRLSYHPAS